MKIYLNDFVVSAPVLKIADAIRQENIGAPNPAYKIIYVTHFLKLHFMR